MAIGKLSYPRPRSRGRFPKDELFSGPKHHLALPGATNRGSLDPLDVQVHTLR
jgi:hypothetical protein